MPRDGVTSVLRMIIIIIIIKRPLYTLMFVIIILENSRFRNKKKEQRVRRILRHDENDLPTSTFATVHGTNEQIFLIYLRQTSVYGKDVGTVTFFVSFGSFFFFLTFFGKPTEL